MDALEPPALVAAILAGDAARFADVVRRYDDPVRRTVGRSITDADSVEEIVQQTFYRAFRSLDTLRDPQALEAWLLRIARNGVAEHRRVRGRRREVALPPEDLAPAATAVGEDRWVWDEVARLPASFREVLELRYREGRSYREVAGALRVPISTVRGRIYEARKALRRRLASEGDET